MAPAASTSTLDADRSLGPLAMPRLRSLRDHWMVHKDDNPNPVAYSVGEPLFKTGWSLLALAMSQPLL